MSFYLLADCPSQGLPTAACGLAEEPWHLFQNIPLVSVEFEAGRPAARGQAGCLPDPDLETQSLLLFGEGAEQLAWICRLEAKAS